MNKNKIALVDVDGHNFPNLPLMKISAYHKNIGDDVEVCTPFSRYDRIYISKVFTFSSDYNTVLQADEIIYGGTGYNLTSKLLSEIEHIYPDYELYNKLTENTAYGFLTRGCPRNCEFCIVSDKEGHKSVTVADLDEFWSGQREIKLLDPNLTACNEREKLLQQLVDSNAWVDFTQGIDIRLIDGLENLITKIKTKMIHFAWDDPLEDLTVQFSRFKQKTNIDMRRLRVYVLTNFNSTHEQDLYRVYKLREMGYDPYIMIFNKQAAPQNTKYLARWVNNKIIFRCTEKFEDYNPKLG